MTHYPSSARSRKSLAFTAAAAAGRFRLQRCGACANVSYPAREICPRCWSLDLRWAEMPEGGRLVTETTLRTSFNHYFQERLPWRIGTVQLDAGPVVLAHVHGEVTERGRVRMIARTDKSGQGVLMALPDQETANMTDDRQLRALTCDPRLRRVLVTDGSTAAGRAIAEAIAAAGAAEVLVGVAEGQVAGSAEAESWLKELDETPGLQQVPLDVGDTDSVEQLAVELDGEVDILVHTGGLLRAGRLVHSGDPARAGEGDEVAHARDEMERDYFALLRLVRAFGPLLRRPDPVASGSGRAWVNLLAVEALTGGSVGGSVGGWAANGTCRASQAAAWSLSRCLRAEMAGSGVKVINLLVGPLDDAWHQSVPPPKVSAAQLAAAVVRALQQGLELVPVGPVAEGLVERFGEDPLALERELAQVHP